ncbi:MAG: hypothetical protein HY399_03895, partial [Elusimicrobia bacterium]|nr:hypothetical protein [Elusimicrobiota bacterium]
VDPIYYSKDPGEIFLSVAQKLKGAVLPENFDSYFRARAKKLGAGRLLDLENGEKRWLELNPQPSENPLYSTRSKKFEFDALTELLNHQDNRKTGEDREFPLSLHLYTPLSFSFGEGAHLPYLQSVAGPNMQEAWETWAEIHPGTAQEYRITDGESVWIESRVGKIKAKARLHGAAMPGVVSLPLGLGHSVYGRWAQGVGSNPMEIGEEAAQIRVRRT